MTDYVIIDLDALATNANVKPFKNALNPIKARSNKKGRESKTLESAFFYVFTADVGDTRYLKIGETGNDDTYHSKERYCPWQEYRGMLQVQHYGTVIERLMKAYLRTNYKKSEWYHSSDGKMKTFLLALERNAAYQPETPIPMTNVGAFQHSFTGKYKATLDDYLSVFRASYKGKLYVLNSENLQLPIRELAVDKWRYSDAVTPAAPAAPLAVAPTPPPSPVVSNTVQSGAGRAGALKVSLRMPVKARGSLSASARARRRQQRRR